MFFSKIFFFWHIIITKKKKNSGNIWMNLQHGNLKSQIYEYEATIQWKSYGSVEVYNLLSSNWS